ncbi:Forkhead-associated (FHA) domain protein [Kalmanozyma brasiliensis GHG001]|uniref:FHA domain-containing protein n=1 Tax=Kalmanozyma brasiliensis (strain GHG001) TaxID=1365824 RepID=V5EVY1_KALBG|nr:Forkhead-associated (FHA) domain protein [Kalmanozyma brasiliensis GHG001]EST06439.1 Forkhead-associated (FHA) domain protein [Kalmanozyma brasiliensis GHG001]
MSLFASACGLELVWVNPSSEGASEKNAPDPERYRVIRIPAGHSKIISRSSSPTVADLINDLDDKICFEAAKVVSREHATIEWIDRVPFIKDLGSTHGTFVAHRRAYTLSSGRFAEENALAPSRRIEGIEPLRDGDLIEFGRTTVRPERAHFPVRCYLRLASQRASSSPNVPIKKPGVYGLTDDSFDSESDIVSIDADAFRATAATKTHAPQEVVDLTSEDEDEGERHDPVFKASAEPIPTMPASSLPPATECNDPPIPGHDVIVSYDEESSASDSDESVDPYDITPVAPLRDEIQALIREAREAQNQGDLYMESYKTIQCESPATSIGGDSPIREKAKERDSEQARDVSPSHMLIKDATVPCASAASVPSSSASTTAVVPELFVQGSAQILSESSPLKRKADSMDAQVAQAPVDATQVDATQADATHVDQTQADIVLISEKQPAQGDPEPHSPNKKTRLSPVGQQQERVQPHNEDRTPNRARKVGNFVAKAVHTTSLLSVGFLAGSLFTFKSMMNAAATANAAGSGK